MAEVLIGRRMAEIEGDVVVFLVGMRIHRWWKLHTWWLVARALPHTGLARAGRSLTLDGARATAKQRLAAHPGAASPSQGAPA